MPISLTAARVRAIKEALVEGGLTQAEIAEQHGTSQSQVSRIATDRAWRSVPWPGAAPVGAPDTAQGIPLPAQPNPEESKLRTFLGERTATVMEHLADASRGGVSPLLSDEMRAREDEDLFHALVSRPEEEE